MTVCAQYFGQAWRLGLAEHTFDHLYGGKLAPQSFGRHGLAGAAGTSQRPLPDLPVRPPWPPAVAYRC